MIPTLVELKEFSPVASVAVAIFSLVVAGISVMLSIIKTLKDF